MMTLQLNPFMDHANRSVVFHCWQAFCAAVLAMAVMLAPENHCAAQNIIYSQSYPVTNSYPTSYPLGHNVVVDQTHLFSGSAPYVSVPEFVDSNAVYSTTVIGQPWVQNRGVSSAQVHDSTTATHSLSTTESTSRRGPVARLASTHATPSRPPFPLDRSDSRRALLEANSSYGLSMIESARRSAAQFRRIAATVSPMATKIAEENAGFADQWATLAETHAALSRRIADASTKLDSTTRDYEDVNSKLTKYGLTPTIGLLLRHKQEQLNAWQVQDSQTVFANEEIQRSRQKQLELEMVQYAGANPTEETAEILNAAGYDPTSQPSLASQIHQLLVQRGQWLGSLRQGYQEYQQKLGELDSKATVSAKLTNDYRQLIDRHITWIRSGDPVSVRDFGNLKGGLGTLFDFRRSGDFGPTLERKWKADSVGGITLLVWIALLLLARWYTKSWLVGIGSRNRMRESTANSRKLAAGVSTILVAMAFPCVLYAIARWLGTGVVSESTLYASSGFYAASLVALGVELPRQLLRNHGYLARHVSVTLPRRERAAKFLTVIGFGLVVAAYAIIVMGSIDHGMWRDSLARFGFMAAMLLVAWTMHLALRPSDGALEPWIAKFGGKVIHRVRFMIYILGVGFPLVMLVLSALGYGFTANELIKRAIISMTGLLVAATLWAGVKILSAHAWRMLTGTAPPPRQFDEYGEIESPTNTGEVGVLGEHFLELKHHLAFLCQFALVVVGIVGFGWLWIDIFPNVQMGNPVVWNVQDTITLSSVDATGDTVTRTVTETTPVTAFHLLLAAATLFVAFQLAKLLPALFDALVLQRVSFDESMEHFSLVLGRCLLFGVGCFIACKWIGVRWEAVQWLAVGLTVGLGFGLQDMVRNLFGGLIVLFEKPARLGDLITVGDATGRVAMQRLRTTVLSDEEGREVIVPNKNFVSEEVVNWMGAGRLSVIPIEVAVTRDERPADICRTLQELVIAQPHVLLHPAPQATLVCVGRQSQRIELRAWVEESHDAKRFRDSLLTVVRRFLREHEFLAADQPSQPAIRQSRSQDVEGTYQSSRRRAG